MPRPKRFRKIFREPELRCFKPDFGGYNKESGAIEITMDEFEAIRLKDYQKINQEMAAELIGISQPTLHRILNSARGKIAKALVDGKILNINEAIT